MLRWIKPTSANIHAIMLYVGLDGDSEEDNLFPDDRPGDAWSDDEENIQASNDLAGCSNARDDSQGGVLHATSNGFSLIEEPTKAQKVCLCLYFTENTHYIKGQKISVRSKKK